MKAARLVDFRSMHVAEVPKPQAGPGELLIRVLAAGVCGSDRHMYKGEYPTAKPVTLGHEFCGRVEAVGTGVNRFFGGELVTVDPNIACGSCAGCRRGRPNLCVGLQAIGVTRDGGFAEWVTVPESQAFRLPEGLDPVHGAFCEPLACCLHAIDKAAIRPGDSVAILGGGVIGLLMLQLARMAGAGALVLITRQKSRRDMAERLGATLTIDPSAHDPVAVVREACAGGVDVAIECAGVPETLQAGLAMTRRGGTFVLFGVAPAGQTAPVIPFDLLFNEIDIRPAFLNPHTHQRAADLVASRRLVLDDLVTHVVSLDEAPKVIASEPLPGEIKVIVKP